MFLKKIIQKMDKILESGEFGSVSPGAKINIKTDDKTQTISIDHNTTTFEVLK